MKTKIFLLSLFVGFSAHIFAQESQSTENQLPGYRTAFVHSSAGENWFVNISAGGQMYNPFTDAVSSVGLAKRVSLIPAIAVGKWFNPYWGFRVKAQGFTDAHAFNDVVPTWMQKINYYNVHLDAMWNLANYWGKYNPKRLFNFTPYVGLGFAHKNAITDQTTYAVPQPLLNSGRAISKADYYRESNALSVNPGIQFGFRLSNRINLDFDLGATILGDYFERIHFRPDNDVIYTAMGGFTFKLGKTTFDIVEPMNHALIDELNGKINALRNENDQLRKRPVSCPQCPPPAAPAQVEKVATAINYVPNVVFFRINSSQVDANQQINIYNTAKFMKDTGSKIKVIGYADKATGSSKYNLALSEKRAKAVAKELTTKYNIPSNNITVEWKGSDVQPYSQNEWNRVVIMTSPQ